MTSIQSTNLMSYKFLQERENQFYRQSPGIWDKMALKKKKIDGKINIENAFPAFPWEQQTCY